MLLVSIKLTRGAKRKASALARAGERLAASPNAPPQLVRGPYLRQEMNAFWLHFSPHSIEMYVLSASHVDREVLDYDYGICTEIQWKVTITHGLNINVSFFYQNIVSVLIE